MYYFFSTYVRLCRKDEKSLAFQKTVEERFKGSKFMPSMKGYIRLQLIGAAACALLILLSLLKQTHILK